MPYEPENVYENAVSNDSNANNVMYSDAVVNDMQSHLLPDLTVSSTVDSRSPKTTINLCSDSEANYTVKDDIEDNLEVENTNAVKNIL